jgi:THO complex subunit 1
MATSFDKKQLSDLAFQRHILVQALILIDFLLSLTEKAKKKWLDVEKTSSKSANRGLLYSFTLSEENACTPATRKSS